MSVYTLFILSDGTGETATQIIRAALVQFPDRQVKVVRYKNIRREDQLAPILDEAKEQNAFVAYTLVTADLSKKVRTHLSTRHLVGFDLLSPLIDLLTQFLGGDGSSGQAGLLHAVDEDYFKRIEAIEYTVKHDDGKCLTDFDKADVILVGISRTSKTPLSIFLSHKGLKVVNIPLVKGTPLPKELFAADQRKVVGLLIDIEALRRIRKNRLDKFGQDPQGEYASITHIHEEIEYAHELFKQNRKWPVFDVTDRALEETASEITRIVGARLGWLQRDF